jgi:hypothetical protein
MKKTHKKRYCRKKKTTNNMIQLATQLYINEINGRFQNKVWKPGKLGRQQQMKWSNNMMRWMTNYNIKFGI